MKLPNWFKVVWWIVLLAGLGVILAVRLPAIIRGEATIPDVLLSFVWIALWLLPLYGEVSIFGITLKQVEDLKKDVSALRTDIRNSVDLHAQVNPTFHFPAPPPDSQLPVIEDRLRSVVQDALRTHGVQPSQTSLGPASVPDDATFLFRYRYAIEKELRRIWHQRMLGESGRRPVPVLQIARHLADDGLLDPGLSDVVRQVYSVASPAIHGEPVSSAQVAFVKDVGSELLAALKAIE